MEYTHTHAHSLLLIYQFSNAILVWNYGTFIISYIRNTKLLLLREGFFDSNSIICIFVTEEEEETIFFKEKRIQQFIALK